MSQVDLTKIDRPFGLLDPETKDALRKWENGVEIFYCGSWDDSSYEFNPDFTYRARPAPLTPDTIDWTHVAPEWKWMARDKDGTVYFFDEEPEKDYAYWGAPSEMKECQCFASYRRGTVAWQDSLVQRHE